MAYYLNVDKGRSKGENRYEQLNIINCSCFPNPRVSGLIGIGVTEEEFDYFSMHFNDETELRNYLLNNGILKKEDADRTLTLRKKEKGKMLKVRHDFLYQKDIDYVFDPLKIVKRIDDKLWVEHDFRFIQKFANNYLNFRECSSTAPEVRNAISESIRNNDISNLFAARDENGDELLTRMVKLLLFKHYQTVDGKVHYMLNYGDDTLAKEYRNVHSIIAFINNYERKKIEEENQKKEQMTMEIKQKPALVRTLVPNKLGSKKYILDDQTSLFD